MNHPRLATIGAAAVPRVLQVPELFDLIIGDLNKHSLTKAARVCKQWSEVALGHLWETQTDLRPLFNLLASKGYQLSHNKLDLKGLPTERDWHRFYEYSRRVRSLKFDDTDERYILLLDTFARLRPFHIGENGNLFPALRSFTWIGPTEHSLLHRSVLFMHPGIRTFSITLPNTYAHTVPGAALRQYIDHVIGRMPRVEKLSIQMRGYMAVVEPFILQLVTGFSKSLTTLEIPRYWSSTALIETLSALPRFKSLQSPEYGGGVYDPSRRFKPSIPSNVNPWPALEKLHLAAPFQDVTQFLKNNTIPSSLGELHVRTPRLESRAAVRELCLEISRKCKGVQYLLISKCQERALDRPLRPTLDECPSIEDLQPLFSSLSLVEFSFHHEFPLVFKDSLVPSIADLLPKINFLDLNSQPDFEPAQYSAGDFPSIQSLPAFGPACQDLTELCIYLDNHNFDYPRIAASPSVPETLDALFLLSVGGPGNVTLNANEVLMFLSLVLHEDCTVLSATVSRSRGIPKAVTDKRDKFWSAVNERLPLLVKVREEEVMRMEKMEDALERAETEILRCGGDVSVLDDEEGDSDEAEMGVGVDVPDASAPFRRSL